MHILSPNFSFDGVTIDQVIGALPLSDDDYAFYRDFFIAPNSKADLFIEFISYLRLIRLNIEFPDQFICNRRRLRLRSYVDGLGLSMIRLESLVKAMGLLVAHKGRLGKCVIRPM